MVCPAPHVREAGSGPAVVCLHCNASGSAQWQALMDGLAPTHRVLAPDLYGAGKSPDWHSDRVIALADDALMTEPTPLAAFGTLQLPVLLMTGAWSTAAALGVARRLSRVIPKLTRIDFPGLGHLGPITNAQTVNVEIARFLQAAT